MNDLVLFSTPLCPFAHRVRLVLSHKRLAARVVSLDLHEKPDDFLAISPEGTVPALRHGAHGISDSAVILEYLEERFPDVAMLPSDPLARASAKRWMRIADARLYGHTWRLLHSTDPAVHAAMLGAIEADLIDLESAAFKGKPESAESGPSSDSYWLGAQLTLVDATYYPWFEQFGVLESFFGLLWPKRCERLARWRDAMARHPSVAAIAQSSEFYLRRYGALRDARLQRNG